MKEQILVHKPLPQNPDIWVSVPNYKEPILPVSNGFGWYGLQSFDFQGDKLMCHKCGGFFDNLSKHLYSHNLTSQEYKREYSLLRKAKLCSLSYSEIRKNISLARMEDPHYKKTIIDTIMRVKPSITDLSTLMRQSTNCLEYQNQRDTCKQQLLRGLMEASKIYGDAVTGEQASSYRSGLKEALVRRFGTFNKAKQMLKLAINPIHPIKKCVFDKRIILEDLCSFYRENHKWATEKDYHNGLMICSYFTVLKNGGLVILIKEAQQLKDEQDKRNNIDIKGIANRIEMGYAGRARV